MSDRYADVVVRLIARDEGLKKALKEAGPEGEKAFRLLEKASDKARPSLKAVDEVAKDLRVSVDQLIDKVGPLGSGLKGLGPIGFGVAAGIGAAVAAFWAMHKAGGQAIETLSAVGDRADKLTLATDTYQTLSFEAARARIAEEELDAALMAANKTTSEAALGTGEFYSNLILLNPEMVKEVQNADSLEDRLKAVAKGYANASSEVERNSILLRTFGDNGIRAGEAVLTLEGGIEQATKRAKEAGVVFSEDLIRASQEAAAKIAEADKRIEVSKTRLKVAFTDQTVSNKQAYADFLDFIAGDALKNTIEGQIAEVDRLLEHAYKRRERLQNPQGWYQEFEASGKRNHNLNRWAIDDLEKRREALLASKKARDEELEATKRTQEEEERLIQQTASLTASLNRLRAESKSMLERKREALDQLNKARESGMISSDTEYNRLRAYIIEKYKDVAAIRAQEKAERDRARAAADADRALARGIDIRMGLSNEQERAAAITEKVARYQAELTSNMKAYGLTQAQVTMSVEDYRHKLDGTVEAKRRLDQAMNAILSPTERYRVETQALIQAQQLVNIPTAEFNRLLAARKKGLEDLKQAEAEQAQREQFGETLEDAKVRILESLKTSEEVIDAKIEVQKKIIAALGTSITPDQAREYLANYRKELEEAANKTDDLSSAQRRLGSIMNRQIRSWGDLKDVALDALQEIIKQLIFGQKQMNGFGGFLQSILGGGQGGFGGGFGGGSAGGQQGGIFSGISNWLASIFHDGTESVGQGRTKTRHVPASTFYNAPRFHKGVNLASDERAAILQTGERVLSRGDNREFTRMMAMFSRAISRPMSVPAAARGIALKVNYDGQPSNVEVRDQGVDRQGRQQLELWVKQIAKSSAVEAVADGQADTILESRYNLRKRAGAR